MTWSTRWGCGLAAATGQVALEDLDAIRDYATDVPLFESGAAAYEHGMRDVDAPGKEARNVIRLLLRRLS